MENNYRFEAHLKPYKRTSNVVGCYFNGFIVASSLQGATESLLEYFGEDYIDSFTIYCKEGEKCESLLV